MYKLILGKKRPHLRGTWFELELTWVLDQALGQEELSQPVKTSTVFWIDSPSENTLGLSGYSCFFL